MNLDAQVAILHQVATRPVERVQGGVETEKSVSLTEVGARQTVPFVLRHFAGLDEQFDVTRDVPLIRKIRLKVFDGDLSTVHLHGEEVDVVVLGVKRFFGVPLTESAVVNAAQHQTFRQGS